MVTRPAPSLRPVHPSPSPRCFHTLRGLIREGRTRLRMAGVERARSEVEQVLAHLTGFEPLALYLEPDQTCSEALAHRFFEMLNARAGGVPLQYVLGEAAFCGERFTVRPGVFIPRPETEAIVEAALRALRVRAASDGPIRHALDLGTGSGCIAATLARSIPSCLVTAVEVSWDALSVARLNIARQALASRVRLVQGRWCEPLSARFDIIVSNPPYVPSARVNRLPLDVRREPRESLDGGEDGLSILRMLLRDASHALQPSGLLVLECGEEHVQPLMRQARAAPWMERVAAIRDVADRPRGIIIQRKR